MLYLKYRNLLSFSHLNIYVHLTTISQSHEHLVYYLAKISEECLLMMKIATSFNVTQRYSTLLVLSEAYLDLCKAMTELAAHHFAISEHVSSAYHLNHSSIISFYWD